MPRETWVIVLAAGDGTRLGALATDARGIRVPKQFLTFGTERSLLRTTIERARALVPGERIITVVAASHEPWWRRELADGSLGNVLVQPRNAGTAAGLLLPVLSLLRADPGATALVLPSDHHVEDEAAFGNSLRRLVPAAEQAQVVLLGMEPDGPEVQYGWIVPSPSRDGGAHRVAAFVEKPAAHMASSLYRQGALWSTFVMAASAALLRILFRRATPALTGEFERAIEAAPSLLADARRLGELYDRLPTADFSASVLQHPDCRDVLRVLPASPCGWTDLGTPERVARAFPGMARADATKQRMATISSLDQWRALHLGAQR